MMRCSSGSTILRDKAADKNGVLEYPISGGKEMTLDEKLDIGVKAAALDDAGKREEASKLIRSIPMPPYLAKIAKEKIGADFLINGGWNLSEAEAEFGQGWLAR
jgi:hypothetical protein